MGVWYTGYVSDVFFWVRYHLLDISLVRISLDMFDDLLHALVLAVIGN